MRSKERAFLIEWAVASAIAMPIANFLGSSVNGIITGNKGHLLLGGTLALAQAIVLSRHYAHPNRLVFFWWVAVSAIGFMVGANLAWSVTLNVLAIPEDNFVFLVPFVFLLCLPLTIGQWAVLRWIIYKSSAVDWWLPASIIAWSVNEWVSSLFGHARWYMVVFGLFLALITGIFWVRRIGPALDART